MIPRRILASEGRFASRCANKSLLGRRWVHIERKLEELGITLPPAPTPKANYNIVCHASGNMMYVSGHLPLTADGKLLTGRIGPASGGETIEHGYEAARHAGLNIISTLKEQLGDLDRVEQVVKVRGRRS
jgi:enamine deaminase RidA (YjgF/YER057c/UK114 family)